MYFKRMQIEIAYFSEIPTLDFWPSPQLCSVPSQVPFQHHPRPVLTTQGPHRSTAIC